MFWIIFGISALYMFKLLINKRQITKKILENLHFNMNKSALLVTKFFRYYSRLSISFIFIHETFPLPKFQKYIIINFI